MKERLEYNGALIPIGAKVLNTATGEAGVVQEAFGDNSLVNHPDLSRLVPVLFEGGEHGICAVYVENIVEVE